jgi:hypothetical protein
MNGASDVAGRYGSGRPGAGAVGEFTAAHQGSGSSRPCSARACLRSFTRASVSALRSYSLAALSTMPSSALHSGHSRAAFTSVFMSDMHGCSRAVAS